MTMIRFYFVVLCTMFFLIDTQAQDQQKNLEKYWRYRQRLRDNFIVVNQYVEKSGTNLPASAIDLNNDIIDWGDANSGISHYLSVLATELYLLKNNEQPYTTTLKELYYLMLALERIDTYSEYYHRLLRTNGRSGSVNADIDINGFCVRDDVSSSFFNNNLSHFPVRNLRSTFEDLKRRELSQDNIYHNLEGLSLVASLVGTEDVSAIPVSFINTFIPTYLQGKGIKNGNSVNFSLWAKDFVKRYLKYMQSNTKRFEVRLPLTRKLIASLTNHWVLKNPITGDYVNQGSGSGAEMYDIGFYYNVGAVQAGNAITGENLRQYDPFILSVSAATDIYNTALDHGGENINITVVNWPFPFNKFIDPISVHVSAFDHYKVATLATIGNLRGTETFSFLRSKRDQPTVYGPYEHFPLMYTTLHDPCQLLFGPEKPIYSTDKVIIENLLNTAPECGPTSNGNINWSSDSRLVWPERLGKSTSERLEYSGLDYMMLHNLYYIAFRGEEFRNVSLSSSTLQSGDYYAKFITTASSVAQNSTVSLKATQSISLKPGFKVAAGSTFRSTITGQRANNYIGAMYKSLVVPMCGTFYPNGGSSGGRIEATSGGTETATATASTTNDLISFDDLVIFYDTSASTARVADATSTEISSEVLQTEKSESWIYPNPTKGKFTIWTRHDADMTLSVSSVTVLNSVGKEVERRDGMNLDQSNFEIDLSPYPSGVYIIKIETNHGMRIERVVKQ